MRICVILLIALITDKMNAERNITVEEEISVRIRPDRKVYVFGSILTANVTGVGDNDSVTYVWTDMKANFVVHRKPIYTIFKTYYKTKSMWEKQQLQLKIQVNGIGEWHQYSVYFDIWNKTKPQIPDEPNVNDEANEMYTKIIITIVFTLGLVVMMIGSCSKFGFNKQISKNTPAAVKLSRNMLSPAGNTDQINVLGSSMIIKDNERNDFAGNATECYAYEPNINNTPSIDPRRESRQLQLDPGTAQVTIDHVRGETFNDRLYGKRNSLNPPVLVTKDGYIKPTTVDTKDAMHTVGDILKQGV